ncbi:2OG-Fe(II) oxygenase [Shewanella sp. Isolate11]|uniref:2OG-Fe(II) oxygenase n=1 Tax=Shewanella sp. Isolate11 TaxID=2908530 RepID=UPI001EFE800E|nr:2OG-Fe(II) oxygenase [Shewanella sp. Isolate11]MCG9696750.1 2OG-Fe(II) oxygenase [Shewanella sp. Isolate11]
MNSLAAVDNTANLNHICDGLAEKGYVILNQLFSDQLLEQLANNLTQLDANQFKTAAIGRQHDQQVVESIRRDKICWLNDSMTFASPYFEWSEQLRLAVNRHFFLGLFDYETMFAYYEPGAFYKRHLDAFKGQSNRKLTSILYLNKEWQQGDGGELLIYQGDQPQPFATVEPRFGTMVIFFSEQFPHEVTLSKKDRYSLTGWYRINQGIL